MAEQTTGPAVFNPDGSHTHTIPAAVTPVPAPAPAPAPTPVPVPAPVPPVPPAGTNPAGPPGSWTLVFNDEFTGTALNPAHWTALEGAHINNAVMNASAVSVAGGYCRLKLPSTINSNPANDSFGAGADGPVLAVGDCVEAVISFPGPSGTECYNWPAFWAAGNNWPAAGEEDIAEGYNGSLSALNYHSPAGADNGPFPPGSWCNSFHTYTCVRGAKAVDVYWDGRLMRSVAPDDNGGPQSIMITVGAGNTESASAVVQVKYVRVWTPA